MPNPHGEANSGLVGRGVGYEESSEAVFEGDEAASEALVAGGHRTK